MKKKKIIILLAILIVITILFVGFSLFNNNLYEEPVKETKKVKETKDILIDIKKNYNTTVSITSDAKIYKQVNNEFVDSGLIYKNSIIDLEYIETLTKDNEYFKLADSNYYVHYNDVMPNKKIDYDKQYKNYIVFDKIIKTKENISIYYNNEPLMRLDESLEFEIIIDDSDVYYVEFLGRLCSIRKTDVLSTSKSKTTDDNVLKEIAVLNYHFFFDPNKKEVCNESICLKKSYFEEHLKYIKDNNYYTVSTKELDLWMDKKINLPKKSVLITVDDGAMGTDTHLIELLEKYNLKGTLFLITAWWPKEKYQSNNLEIQSHGNDIHLENYCSGVSRGAKGLCLTKEKLVKDFKESVDKLDGEKTAFCYPFYLYNKNMIDAIKEVGFKVAFAGGERKAVQSDDKYKIPRFVIYSYTTANDIARILR